MLSDKPLDLKSEPLIVDSKYSSGTFDLSDEKRNSVEKIFEILVAPDELAHS